MQFNCRVVIIQSEVFPCDIHMLSIILRLNSPSILSITEKCDRSILVLHNLFTCSIILELPDLIGRPVLDDILLCCEARHFKDLMVEPILDPPYSRQHFSVIDKIE